jgi:hypothetical protein
VDSAVGSALIGVGGVVVGVALTAVVDWWTREKVASEQAEQARYARELVAAEGIDEGFIRAQEALEARMSSKDPGERYGAASEECGKAWVAYGPRLRRAELRDRVEAVKIILNEAALGGGAEQTIPSRIVMQAIANARATLGRFMRGDRLPANAFPPPTSIRTMLNEGEAQGHLTKPLEEWLKVHPQPDFHDDVAS